MDNATAATLPEWVPVSVTALQAFLKSHPDAERQVREILDKRLDKIDGTTWRAIFASLDNYLGKESTDLLFNVAQPDQAKRLEDISDAAPHDVMNFLRTIISLYGPELANAFLISNQLPNNWKMFYRDVYYDYINKRSHLRVRIAKYNGEEASCHVSTRPNSVLLVRCFFFFFFFFDNLPYAVARDLSRIFRRHD
ncbi:MAG: hypothetical protein HY780_05855 [Chloroflexi bacterium]|nr:hypothetical protein [Chloroflexota bacterium]